MDDTTVATADYNARNWTYAKTGPIKTGSPEHSWSPGSDTKVHDWEYLS